MAIQSVIFVLTGTIVGVFFVMQLHRLFFDNPLSVIHAPAFHEIMDISKLESEQKRLETQLSMLKERIKFIRNNRDSKVPLYNMRKVNNAGHCSFNFKVYVYNLPKTIGATLIGEEARTNKTLHVCHKCILEQFALEYIMEDFFLNFCGRTLNPEEADFFYLPLVRDAEFRLMMQMSTRNRAPSQSEQALLLLMEKNDSSLWKSVFNLTDRYWHAKGGADHIVVMPAPVTNLRHETSQRGFFHYMMHLHAPIFLCLEYTTGFVTEYPVCTKEKNIVMPYPTVDPELYNGKLVHDHIKRSHLIYYAGGMHGDCVEVRKALKVLMANSTNIPGIVPPVPSNMAEREHGFMAATFCPVPIGDSPSSKRMYDVLNFGCIPVVLSDDLVWALSDQTGGPINHKLFSLQFPQSVIHFTAHRTLEKYKQRQEEFGYLPSGLSLYTILESTIKRQGNYDANGNYLNPLVQILQNIPPSDVMELQRQVRLAAPHFQYYALNSSMSDIPLVDRIYPRGGAIEIMADLLSQRKRKGTDNIHARCRKEITGTKHKYVSRYTCEGRDKAQSLVRI